MNRGLCFSRMCRPLAWVWGAWLLLDPTGAPSQDKAVEPPLFEAVRSGTMEDVQARIAAGADPIGRDEQGLSPLDWALKLGRYPIARALLPHQTRVHKADPLPLAIGMDIRIGGPLPAEGSAWVAAPCIAKVWRTVRFCVEAITWPETLVAALRVRSHLYQGA